MDTNYVFVSKYINDNAEVLRPKFVDHDGTKKLIIKEYANSLEESLLMEKNWDFFFEKIIEKIDENTIDGTVEKLQSDFSTTDTFHRLVSTTAIMDSMKKYFSYGRMICMCGINNVIFKGNIDDWLKLSEKLVRLTDYDVDGKMIKYIEHVGIILDQFVQSFNNNVDVSFWNNILQSESRRIGSGDDTDTLLTGWILHFYGIYDMTVFEDMDSMKTNVPIKLYNEYTNTTKDLELTSYFSDVCQIDNHTFAPRTCVKINVEKVTNDRDSFFS